MKYIFIASALLMLTACEKSPTQKVQEESVDIVVNASGELESKQKSVIAPPSISRMWQYQIKQMVPENSRVKKGQVLVSFDDKKVTDRLVDKQGELNQAIKELDNKKIKETEKEQELILAVAEKEMNYKKNKRKADIVDNSRSEVDRKKAIIDFTIAENDLALAKLKLAFHQKNTDLNLKLAKGKVDRLESEASALKHEIDRLKVKSPIDGMVIYRANWQGEKPAVGESVQFGQPVIEVAVIESMQLKAQVDEPDSGKIKTGQRVKIAIDGAQEVVMMGRVSGMGRVFREKSHQDKRRIVDAIIALDAPDLSLLRPGMAARVEIITEQMENALTIPTKAVKQVAGDNTVILVGAISDSRVVIELGDVIGSKAVVTKGLSKGDEVML